MFTVILGRIGQDTHSFTFWVEAANVTDAINRALRECFIEFFSDVYDDEYSMAEDSYELHGVFSGHLENLV